MSSRGDCLTGVFEPFYIPVKGIAPPLSLEEARNSGVDGGGGNHRRGAYDESSHWSTPPWLIHGGREDRLDTG